jgi:hypothetical protein
LASTGTPAANFFRAPRGQRRLRRHWYGPLDAMRGRLSDHIPLR